MRSPLRNSAIILGVLISCIANIGHAESQAYKAEIAGDLAKLKGLHQKVAKSGEKFSVVKLHARNVANIGAINFSFDVRKLPAAEAVFVSGMKSRKDAVVPLLMKGHAYLNRRGGTSRKVSAALSVIKQQVRIQFSTAELEKDAKAPRLYAISWRMDKSPRVIANVSTKQNAQLLNKLCDSHKHEGAKKFSSLAAITVPAKAVTSAKIVTLSTDADPEWYAKYGDASNAEIAAIINAAEAIFERQLQIRFALVRQHVYVGGSPYLSTDASTLLSSFAKNIENPANLGLTPLTFDEDVDVKHLFTGKELTGNVIGLSYVGALCWSSKNAYGLTQNTTRELNITTFMHEMGHTFGAAHDESDVGGIMYPNLGIKRYFSPVSVSQMTRFLSTNGKCVAEQLVGANLANATLTLAPKRTKDRRTLLIKGNLLSNLATPLPGEMIKITLNNKRVVFAMTDEKGGFAYRVKLPGMKSRQLSIFAQTLNNETALEKPLRIQVRA